MNPEIESWLALAKQTSAAIHQISQNFQVLSDTYSPMRNVGFKNNEKEAIDTAYTELNEAKLALCAIQAGGKRRNRKTRKARA